MMSSGRAWGSCSSAASLSAACLGRSSPASSRRTWRSWHGRPARALLGWTTYLLIQGTTLVAGGAVAAWLLYVQHQYEDTYYRAPAAWQFERAALEGSSYLKLPRALASIMGNANYHHVHHLSARIPNYRLRAAHEEQQMFERTPVVTLRRGFAALRLKLRDEARCRLVPFE